MKLKFNCILDDSTTNLPFVISGLFSHDGFCSLLNVTIHWYKSTWTSSKNSI